VIATACSRRDLVHHGAMTAQLWKRSGEEPRVTFRCPWCDVVGVSPVLGRHEGRKTIWLLAGCPNIPCTRGVLIRVPTRARWSQLETDEDGLLIGPSCIFPHEAT
jgi:hypothetical protein